MFSWVSMQGNSNFGAFTAMKAVSTKDKIFVFGMDGTQTKGYVTAQNDGNHWALCLSLSLHRLIRAYWSKRISYLS